MNDDETSFVSSPRTYFLDNYRLIATPFEWNHYLTLSFFTFVDGKTFTNVWNDDTTTWFLRHQIIWYNYKYHLDRSIDTIERLYDWAMSVAHPFLLKHDPAFIDVNTKTSTWRQIQQEKKTDKAQEGWQTVGKGKLKPTNRKNVTYADIPSSPKDGQTCIKPPAKSDDSNSTTTTESNLTVLSSLEYQKTAFNTRGGAPPTEPRKNQIALKGNIGILHKRSNTKLKQMTKTSADAIRAEWEAKTPNPEAIEVTPPTPIQECQLSIWHCYSSKIAAKTPNLSLTLEVPTKWIIQILKPL